MPGEGPPLNKFQSRIRNFNTHERTAIHLPSNLIIQLKSAHNKAVPSNQQKLHKAPLPRLPKDFTSNERSPNGCDSSVFYRGLPGTGDSVSLRPGPESKAKYLEHGPLARASKMTIIAVHGEALDKIGFELCERANRSAELRLEKLLSTYNSMATKAEARHVREQREVQELLERLAKVKAIRKEAALKAHEVRAPVKGHPHVKGDGKLRNETKPKAGRRKPRAMEGPRMADKDPSMWVVVPATLPHVSGRGVRHSDEGGRQAVHGDDDAEEVEAEPPRIIINHTGSRYQELQKHIYYNQCKPGSELLSSRTEATTKAEDADVGKITPGDAPSQLSHATGYVIEGDTVNAVSGTRPGLIVNGGGDQVRDAAEPRLTPQSQAIRDDVDRMYRASLTSTAGAGTPVDDEEDDLKHSDPAKDADLFNTRLPQVIIRRFPDEGDPGDFGVSMRMALNCNQITTPIDRPSRTLSSGRRVFPSLRRDLEPKRSVIHRTQSFKTPLKPGSQASSLPLLPKTSSLVHSEPSRASERYTATRTSQDAEQTHKDLFKYKAIKRKPLKMPTLPIRLRYSKSRESNTTRSQDQKVLDALQHRKRSLRTRIDNFLSDNSSDD